MEQPQQDPHALAHQQASEALFPRGLTAELVAGSIGAERLRTRIRGVVIGLGLALVALGLPTEHLSGGGVEWTARLGVPERWLFLVSALAYGLTYPVLLTAAARLGLQGANGLVAAALVVLSSQAWLAGTLSGPGAVQLLATSVLFCTLVSPKERGLALRASLAWLVAAVLSPAALFLFPAVAWAVVRRTREPSQRALLGLAAGLYLMTQVWTGAEYGGLAWHFSGRPELPTDLLLELPLALGVGTLAWIRLATFRPEPGVGRPPLWVWAWLVVPLVADVAGGRTSLVHLTALPACLVGWSAWVQQAPEGRGARALLALLVVQVGVTAVVAVSLARMTDGSWREQAEQRLEEEDLVLSSSPYHRHLLRHRFGVEVLDLSEGEALVGDARRAWLERLGTRVEEARAAGRIVRYDKDGEAWVADPRYVERLAELRARLALKDFP